MMDQVKIFTCRACGYRHVQLEYDNENSDSNECPICGNQLEVTKSNNVIEVSKKGLETTVGLLNQVGELVNESIQILGVEGTEKLVDILSGTGGVKKVKSKASAIFERYSMMTEAYHQARRSVQHNIDDFSTLRIEIESLYYDFATKLMDLYGDAIKSVAPELFDFNNLEWLDVDNMLKEITLKYDQLDKKCSNLLTNVSESFKSSVQSSLAALSSSKSGDRSLGVLMAGAKMIDHYMTASQLTNQLKSELSTFQVSVKYDATTIKADVARLFVVHKTLSEVVIPKAQAYFRFAEELMSEDIQAVYNALYSDENVERLERTRQGQLARLKECDAEMESCRQAINCFEEVVTSSREVIDSKANEYHLAVGAKPQKPFFLWNILSFGGANKKYYRNYAQWNSTYGPFIEVYEDFRVNLKLTEEDLEDQNIKFQRLKVEFTALNQQIRNISTQIRQSISSSDELKQLMLKHVRDLVVLLKLGREIVESKIDDDLLSTVKIPRDISEETLSPKVEKGLMLFEDTISSATDKLKSNVAESFERIGELAEYKDDMVLDQKTEETIQKGIDLVESFVQLKVKQAKDKMTSKSYDEELSKKLAGFKDALDAVQDKSAYLTDVFRRINLASDPEERKIAIKLLSDIKGEVVTDDEILSVLNGEGQLEL